MNKPWIIKQLWSELVFLHWKVNSDEIAKALQSLVPFELDQYEGMPAVSIVPFRMSNIRIKNLPKAPITLWELNIRTYVRVNDRPGVYFITLDTDSRIANWIAQRFFYLPYRQSAIKTEIDKNRYQFRSNRPGFHFNFDAAITSETQRESFLDWCSERDCLFTNDEKTGTSWLGKVHHQAWSHQKIEISFCDLKVDYPFSGVFNRSPDAASFCRSLPVYFEPFQKISKISR